jgi:hypothetical protein
MGEEDRYYAEQMEAEMEVSINADKAAQKNRALMKSVGWEPHRNLIATKLLSFKSPPDDASFATAIAGWQERNCMSAADGIIGNQTWKEMAPILGVAPSLAPQPPIPQVNSLMLKSGLGFCCRSAQEKRYGLPETILALTQIGMLWFLRHPQGPRIKISEISKRGGGKLPPHVSHRIGLDIDISLMRNDGKESGVYDYKTDPSYSRSLTQELVDIIHKNGVIETKCIFFNDPAVKGVKPQKGHSNHLHVRFCMPAHYKGVLPIKAAYGADSQPPYTCPPYRC